ncbi:MAG: ROK family protein [Eubacteriaceae bacterium]|nr:ROK family protein [Eubacteriaceae bacterium]
MKLLVFDLGGSSIKAGIVDENYDLTDKKKFAVKGDSVETLLEDGVEMLDQISTPEQFVKAMLDIKEDMLPEADGIAFSVNFPFDNATGNAYNGGAANRYLNNTNLYEAFRRETDLPISADNDGKCLLLAEVEAGCLKGQQNAMALGFGTGISCGILAGGMVVRGEHFCSNEVCPIIINDVEKPQVQDLWVAAASLPTMLRKLAAALGRAENEVNGFVAFDLFEKGEYLEYLKEMCRHIAIQIYNFQLILDPGAFAIGGGIAAHKLFVDTIKEEIDRLHAGMSFGANYKPEVRQAKFLSDSNLIGAAAAFRRLYNV